MHTSLAAALVLASLPLAAISHAQARERPAAEPTGVLLIAGPASSGAYVATGDEADADDAYEIPARHAVPIACKSGRDVYAAAPHAWPAPLVILATSDVDRDGLRELIVYAEYVNDYGVAVIEYGSTAAAYSFNCGNI